MKISFGLIWRSFFLLLFYSSNILCKSAQDGFKQQTKNLSDFVVKCVDERFKGGRGLADLSGKTAIDFCKNIEKGALSFGLDLNFEPATEGIAFLNKKFCGFNRITGCLICSIDIDEKKYGFETEINLSGGDGCIESAQDGKITINVPLEAVFRKSGNQVSLIDCTEFCNCKACLQDNNFYKVIEYPCLYQKESGPCGYYSINNILLAYTGLISKDKLLNDIEFNDFYSKLVEYNCGKNKISNIEIANIIRNKVTELCQPNVFISVAKMNNDFIISNSDIMTFGSTGGNATDRILDFRNNGTPQYIILGTADKDQVSHAKNLNLNWDNTNERLNCVENHWLVMTIEWQDPSQPGNCPVIIRVFDSSGPKDNRFAELIHWYYQVFVHSEI